MTTILEAQEKSERVERTASFIVNALVEKAFPLFGPIREAEWAAGWNPEVIYSNDKEIELHMMFRTTAHHSEEGNYLWIVTQYRPESYFIEYTVSTSHRVWFISVKCEPEKAKTKTTVTYSYTGLTAEGNRMNKLALERMYVSNLKDWEEAINYYLRTGKRLE